MPPISFDLPDDNIGTGQELDGVPLKPVSTAKSPMGGHEAKPKFDLRELSPETAANAMTSLWKVPMQDEANILAEATMKKVALDCQTKDNLMRIRLRLYRAKRMLQAKGNEYVNPLVFRIIEDRYLLIETQQPLEAVKLSPEALSAIIERAGK